MSILLKVSGGTVALVPTTSWAAPANLFSSVDRNDGSAYTFDSATSLVTLPSSGLADGYLVVARYEYADTSNGRSTLQGRFIQSSGTGTFVSATSGGYTRDASEDTAYVHTWCFIDNPSASAQIQFQWQRDADAPTGGTTRSAFEVIPLFYSDAAVYSSSTAALYGGTTPNQVTGFSGTDGSNITLSGDVISMTGDNKRYLCLGGQYFAGSTSGSRTQRWHGFRVDGVKDDAAKAYSYYRNASNSDTGDMFTTLVETATATVTLDQFCYRGDGVTNGLGGADVDGGTPSSASHSTVVLELNDSAEVFKSHLATATGDLSEGPTDVDVNETTDFNDSASFTDLVHDSINCVKTNDYLFGANISGASNNVANTQRFTAFAELHVNGTEDTDLFGGDYLRNDQSTTSTFGWSANLMGFKSLTAGDDVGISVTELTGTENGGDMISPAGWSGFWGLNLDTLEGGAPPDTTAPILSSPTGTETGETTATGSVTTDEDNGTLYYYATTNSTESDANILASGATQSVTTTGVQAVSLTGLTQGTTYYLHYLHKDSAGNDSIGVHSAAFTTDSIPVFDDFRQAIIDAFVSGQSETNGWNAERANIALTDVVRTSATVVTITLPALSGYSITANETIAAPTIPAGVLTKGVAITASETFDILATGGASSGSVSDSNAITESTNAVVALDGSVTETNPTDESATAIADTNSSVAETNSTDESATAIIDVNNSVSETNATDDSASTLIATTSSVSETSATDSTESSIITVLSSVSDSNAIADLATAIKSVSAIVSDSVANTDAFSTLLENVSYVTDATTTLTEALAIKDINASVLDATTLTDSIDSIIDILVSLADATASSDSATANAMAGGTFNVLVADSAASSSNSDTLKSAVSAVIDSLTIDETVTSISLGDTEVSIADSESIADALQSVSGTNVIVSESAQTDESYGGLRTLIASYADSESIIEEVTIILAEDIVVHGSRVTTKQGIISSRRGGVSGQRRPRLQLSVRRRR